jgi:hypothetical protein
MNHQPPPTRIRATITPDQRPPVVQGQTGAAIQSRRPKRCGGFTDGRIDLQAEAQAIPPGDGLNLTDRQILLLLRLPKDEAILRATRVYSERTDLFGSHKYLTRMSDAFLKEISVPRYRVPPSLEYRPSVAQQIEATCEAQWWKKYPGGYDCAEAQAETASKRAWVQVCSPNVISRKSQVDVLVDDRKGR